MIRILIADNYKIVRIGLKQILVKEYPSAIIEEAGDTVELVKKVLTGKWDIVICDLNLPGRNGLDALKEIKQTAPKLPVLIMSMYPEDQYALRVLKAGASGYLDKSSIDQELIKAIRTALLGKRFINPSIAEKLAEAFFSGTDLPSHTLLSDREFDVFKLLAAGKTVSEIAAKLSLSSNTVSTYRSRILEKMNMRSNADITRYALEKKLI
jgi:two-component system invasion response regulator UvrY